LAQILADFALAGAAAAVVSLSVLSTPTLVNAADRSYACTDRAAHLVRLSSPLAKMRRLVAAKRSVTIMALGSSSTAGAGASTPAASYPSRLEADLRTRLPGVPITVVNRGVNGEEAGDMLRRLDKAASDIKPDVVLWQLGTNTVLRNHPIGEMDPLITRGLTRMKELDADVVLIDLQFAPAVIGRRDAAEGMVSLIAAASSARSVDLFPRFKVMREWHETEAIPFDIFLSPDLLHMNDWGYACFARLLGAAIAEAATRQGTTAATLPEK
jgi:lysophospholipase L1-like esterase